MEEGGKERVRVREKERERKGEPYYFHTYMKYLVQNELLGRPDSVVQTQHDAFLQRDINYIKLE